MPRNVEELERWIESHPVLVWVYTVGWSVLVGEVAFILHELAKRAGGRP